MYLVLLILLSTTCFIGSLAIAVFIFKRLSTWNLLDRLIAASIPIIVLILSGLILRAFVSTPFRGHTSPLLVPTFGLIHGYQLYYGPDKGPILDTMYGPVYYLSFLPTTLASSPTIAVMLAEFIKIIFYFFPILYLHIGEYLQNTPKLGFALYVFILFFLFTSNSSALSSSAFLINPDAQALGLSAMACAVLYFRKRKDSIPCLLLSGTFIALAVWAKQVTIPLLFALPTYVLLADGLRCFIRYLVCIGITGSVVSLLFLGFFDTKALIFNMFTVPSQHPWIGFKEGLVPPWSLQGVVALIFIAQNMVNQWLWLLVIIILYLGYQFLAGVGINKNNIREWINYNPWVMLVIVTLYMAPISLLPIVKLGGSDNGYSYTLYFLLAATNLVIIKAASESTFYYDHLVQKIAKLLVFVLVITTAYIQAPSIAPAFARLPKLTSNPQELSYNYAKKHPGEVYFPWYPLSSLMAEGKLYHWAYGLYDREMAGYKLSDEHFRSHIPVNVQLVASSTEQDLDRVLKYMPEFSQRVIVDELPGWTVYARK